MRPHPRRTPGAGTAPLSDSVTGGSTVSCAVADKVVADLGLVVSLYDILHIGGGFIYPGEGAAHFQVKFRLIVFRPFVGEVVVGRLERSTMCAHMQTCSAWKGDAKSVKLHLIRSAWACVTLQGGAAREPGLLQGRHCAAGLPPRPVGL